MSLHTEERDGEREPEILIMGGSEVLATVHHLGRDRNEEWRGRAKTMAAAPELAEAVKALHDALSEIMEGTTSADRDGEKRDAMEYEISRDMRAQGWRAIRKSFRALAKLPGGLEE